MAVPRTEYFEQSLKGMGNCRFVATGRSNDLVRTAIDMTQVEQRLNIKEEAYLIDNFKGQNLKMSKS
ncbi:hypothetical protein ABHI18_010874 [Aspergillus niger]